MGTQIGGGLEYVYGYVKVNGIQQRFRVKDSIEQICAFIMQYHNQDVMITDAFDGRELETSGGFISYCRNQDFLRKDLLPVLVPMQQGEVEAPKFVQYVETENYLIHDIRLSSGAGHYLGSLIFDEGYPSPYARDTEYFPSEESVKASYPDSISYEEAIDVAREKGWIR